MEIDNLSLVENRPFLDPVTIVGVGIDIGKDGKGTKESPRYLREHGIVNMLEKIGVPFQDRGTLDCPNPPEAPMGEKNAKHLEDIVAVSEKCAAIVKEEVSKGNKILALGGDHAISIGTVSGASLALEGELGLIYIDAHADAMTPANTLSGNIHGMVTTALLGLGHPALTGIGSPTIKIKKENILYIGLKDLDQGEIDLIREKKLDTATMVDITVHGLPLVFEKIRALQKRVKNVWVSFDHDSVESYYAPAHLMATPGGLSYREIVALSKFIGRTCNVRGVDLVEYVPNLDKDDKTAGLLTTVVANLLGAEYGWYTQYMEKELARKLSSLPATEAVDAPNRSMIY